MGFDIIKYFDQIGKSGEILLYYKGEITEDVISQLLDEFENKINELNVKRKIIKKAYHIFIEALQNLYHHGYKKKVNDFPVNFGIVQVKILNEQFFIRTINLTTESVKKFLEKRLKQLNVLTKEEVSKLYKLILKEGTISDKGGGGLGIVDILRKLGDKINFSFKEYDNNLFFYTFEAKMDVSQ